jgi:trans-aconitate 2-methyltransferase
LARDVWDPQQYRRFGRYRERAALDLIARIDVDAPAAIVDLGCGPGNITRRLAERWPTAEVIGVDASPAMLAAARVEGASISWIEANIARWQPERPVDVVFSNAALHWLDDHATLFPRLVSWLKPNGVLAVQMPRNFDEPSHTAVAETVAAGSWCERLRPLLRHGPVAPPGCYADWILPMVQHLDLWETIYWHVFTGDNPVVEWTGGAALRPLLAELDATEQRAFLADYSARITRAYPPRKDGTTLFSFRRLFVVARR